MSLMIDERQILQRVKPPEGVAVGKCEEIKKRIHWQAARKKYRTHGGIEVGRVGNIIRQRDVDLNRIGEMIIVDGIDHPRAVVPVGANGDGIVDGQEIVREGDAVGRIRDIGGDKVNREW